MGSKKGRAQNSSLFMTASDAMIKLSFGTGPGWRPMNKDVGTIEKIFAAYTTFGASYTAKTSLYDPGIIRAIMSKNRTFFDD